MANVTNWWDHLHARAPKGGEIGIDGSFRRGGEIEPFYIPRPVMPQVDEADQPALIDFIKGQGVKVVHKVVGPDEIKPHQRIEMVHVKEMPKGVLSKPILGSIEPFILDGNHRWMDHKLVGSKMKLIQIMLSFDEAIGLLFKFPKTYSLGVGPSPIRN